MAVQAQYPSNVPFPARGEPERKEMDIPPTPSAFVDPPAAAFFSNGASRNTSKRGREAIVAAPVAVPLLPPQQRPHMNLFSLNSQQGAPQPTLISLTELHNQVPLPLVSTGLRLAVEELKQKNQPSSLLSSSSPSSASVFASSLISDELAAQLSQQRGEIDRFLQTQGEQLRRALAERRKRHYRALLAAAGEVASRRLRAKDAELERAVRRNAELEDRLAQLRAESMAWQAKALAEQSVAAALHAQLQQAAAAGGKAPEDCAGEWAPADDAESAYIDAERIEPSRACRGCGFRPANVVLFPCRHLCLCDACDAASGGGDACPACGCALTGKVQVFL